MKATAALFIVFFAALAHSADAAPVVDSVGITVADMERSVDFYTHVLGFHTVADREVTGDAYEHLFGLFGVRLHSVRLQLGQEQIELMQFRVPTGRPFPTPSHSNDHWFQHLAIVVSDMDAAYARLRQFKVEYGSSAPQRLPDSNPEAGGIQAFYFRDPDGHYLEILSFPPGKGAARWHSHDGLFLGVDHSAIVVSDTQASLRFYRDQLGMRLAGVSDNFGIEQEHLSNVFGARLHITTLRPSAGPGVEFLQYLSPTDGRPMPADTHPNDLWYWQIIMTSTDAQARALPDGLLGWSSARLVQDPDGHTTLIAHP